MKIDNKYNIGDKVFCIRNNEIERITIGNFKLSNDTKLPLEERLLYVMEEKEIINYVYFQNYIKKEFKESELFISLTECLDSLEKNYLNKTK